MLNGLRATESDTPANVGESGCVAVAAHDDLARHVYGLLGVPVDAIDLPVLLRTMAVAADVSWPFLISTPNVNFMVKSQCNVAFRESILTSELCLVDGMPLIWIAKLLRIPIRQRLAGSDLFGHLKARRDTGPRLRVFLFGGSDNLVEKVAAKINLSRGGMECVGALNPGFGTIEEMSSSYVLDMINASGADLLAVFLGAEKAQSWLVHNHWKLRPPLRAQFGATINFEAGAVRRAPPLLRSSGFEWLWRIKEEPYLWRRYLSDGGALLRLFATSVVPTVLSLRHLRRDAPLSVMMAEDQSSVTVRLAGAAIEANAAAAVAHFRNALDSGKSVKVDLSETKVIDPRFFGLFLMVRKTMVRRGLSLQFTGVSRKLRRLFRISRFEYLLRADM